MLCLWALKLFGYQLPVIHILYRMMDEFDAITCRFGPLIAKSHQFTLLSDRGTNYNAQSNMLHQPFLLVIIQKPKTYRTPSLLHLRQFFNWIIQITTKIKTNCRHLDPTTSVKQHLPTNFINYFKHIVTPNYIIIIKTIRCTTKEWHHFLQYCDQLDMNQRHFQKYTELNCKLIYTWIIMEPL